MEPEPVNYQQQILTLLKNTEQITSDELLKHFHMNHEKLSDTLYPQLLSLSAVNYIQLNSKKQSRTVPSKFGQTTINEGSPEARLFNFLPADKTGVSRNDVEAAFGDSYKIAFGTAKRKKLVDLKDDKVFRVAQQYLDTQKELLEIIATGNLNDPKLTKQTLSGLKKAKLIQEKQQTSYIVKKGLKYKEKKAQLKTQITSQMLKEQNWDQYEFKDFNPQAKGLQIANGNLHLLMKTRQQFKEILVEMGFEQMRTDRYVENCFWNFDALFQPQHHPARDAHDTFFVSDPIQAKIDPKLNEYFNEVKKTHQKGGYGSLGYNCDWQQAEAKKNILRTHTTAISSRTLQAIVNEKPFRSRRFFSIDRVFRNQTLDQTHLAEFHQVQGFVIDKNLGLNHLIGVLTEFYKKIGIDKIQLKPTYNPYTQPSMQIYGVHPISGKKIQIGNSGIFRPEMLRPMGFDEDVSVIAWGLGLERPTMIQFGMENIKELFGPGVSIKKVKQSQIYCL